MAPVARVGKRLGVSHLKKNRPSLLNSDSSEENGRLPRNSRKSKIKLGRVFKTERKKKRSTGKARTPSIPPMSHAMDDNDLDDHVSDNGDAGDQLQNSDDEARTSGGDGQTGNAGWAEAMAKILHSKVEKKSAVLAKGKTDEEIAAKKMAKKEDFEIERSSEGAEKRNVEPKDCPIPFKSHKMIQRELREKRLHKSAWENMGRVKPSVTGRDRERTFQRIATKGVVQLFNAVEQRQKTLETKLKEVGSEVKRDQVLKTVTKGEFFDRLKKDAQSVRVGASKDVETKCGDSSDSKPSWNILRDDFMMGAKLKDWDRESESDAENENNEAVEGIPVDSSDDEN